MNTKTMSNKRTTARAETHHGSKPTNAETLVRLMREASEERLTARLSPKGSYEDLAEYLDKHGVKAPEGKTDGTA